MVDVGGAGHNAAVVTGNIVVVVQCAVLGIEGVPTWVVHELALAAVANACGVVWVVAVAAAVVGDAGDISVGDGAFEAEAWAAKTRTVARATLVTWSLRSALVMSTAVTVAVTMVAAWLKISTQGARTRVTVLQRNAKGTQRRYMWRTNVVHTVPGLQEIGITRAGLVAIL